MCRQHCATHTAFLFTNFFPTEDYKVKRCHKETDSRKIFSSKLMQLWNSKEWRLSLWYSLGLFHPVLDLSIREDQKSLLIAQGLLGTVRSSHHDHSYRSYNNIHHFLFLGTEGDS